MASPPKPWEQGGAASQSTTTGADAPGSASALSANSGVNQPSLLPSSSGLPGTAGYSAGIGATGGLYSSPTGPYGPSTSAAGYGAGYGTSVGGVGAGVYGSPYGASSMYGSSPYGGYGGGASSMYGSAYGGGGMYGGGYGGSSYGGYGGGYGSMGYGGYGGGMGGYGGLSRYGGGYGGMGGGYGAPGMLGPEMGWLGGLHQTIGSMGQISELLGMNAEAMQFAFGAFGNFLERIGGASQEVFAFFMGTPPPQPVDPRTGQPLPHMIDPRTGQPVMDPRTGQPMRIPTPEEYKIERKRRFVRWIIGVFVMYMGFRFIRYLFRSRGGSSSSNPSLNAAFNEVSARQMGGIYPGGGMGYGPDFGGASSFAPASFRGGMSDAFENAFLGRKTLI